MNVLQKICADKEIELAERKKLTPLESFIDTLTESKKSLYDALSEPNAGFILECKKASPSKGLIREVFDLDEILLAYTPHAAGISVLTDEKYFQGTYDFLTKGIVPLVQFADGDVIFVHPIQNTISTEGLVKNAFQFEFSSEELKGSELLELTRPDPIATTAVVKRSLGLKASVIKKRSFFCE